MNERTFGANERTFGATFAGAEVADLLHAATIAVVAEVPIERLWEAVAPFSTRSEIWLELLEAHEALTADERRQPVPRAA